VKAQGRQQTELEEQQHLKVWVGHKTLQAALAGERSGRWGVLQQQLLKGELSSNRWMVHWQGKKEDNREGRQEKRRSMTRSLKALCSGQKASAGWGALPLRLQLQRLRGVRMSNTCSSSSSSSRGRKEEAVTVNQRMTF